MFDFCLIQQSAHLGYHVFNNHWRRGYAKEGGEATLDFAFNTLNLHRLDAFVEPQNTASQSVAQTLKMRDEGLKRQRIFQREQWVDVINYSMTSGEFNP